MARGWVPWGYEDFPQLPPPPEHIHSFHATAYSSVLFQSQSEFLLLNYIFFTSVFNSVSLSTLQNKLNDFFY